MRQSIFIGFDVRDAAAFAVARATACKRLNVPIPVRGIVLPLLQRMGLYTRPTEQRGGQLWDAISDAPMSTAFAIARFLTPHLAKEGWALFVDGDVMFRTDPSKLFALAEHSDKAVLCVKHDHRPTETVKMDGQIQTAYPRKNWTSCLMVNVDHPSNRRLTLDLINTAPGRDLHALCWLEDHEIGELPISWNWLVGHSPEVPGGPDMVHLTDGVPTMAGYETGPFADAWRDELFAWAQGEPLP